MAIGFFGWKALRPFSSPLLEWYHSRTDDAERLRLLLEEQADPEAFERYLAEARFAAYLLLPPLFGLFHGVLLGALGGALCAPLYGLTAGAEISASAGAALGMLVGPVLVSFVAGMTVASLAHLDGRLPRRVRWARRGLLVLSPLLLVPALWHCWRRMIARARR